MDDGNGNPIVWGIRKPTNFPPNVAWPLQPRDYPADHEARLATRPVPLKPFNTGWAQKDFGSFFDDIRRRHAEFVGDWWLLCLIQAYFKSLQDHHGDNFTADQVQSFNKYIEVLRNAGVRLLLQHCNFATISLRFVDLSTADISGAKFHKVSLNDASLSDLIAIGAQMEHCEMKRAAANGANFTKAHLPRLNLAGSDLERAVFARARLENAIFEECGLTKAVFDGAALGLASLKGSSLERASLVGATLNGAKLVKVAARGANFQKASLSGADLSASVLDEASFFRANISGVNFDRASIVESQGLFGPRRAHVQSNATPPEEWQVETAVFWWKSPSHGWFRDWVSWQWLRVISGLRLFGVSYLAVIVITAYTLFARWHNTQLVEKARDAAMRARATGQANVWVDVLRELPKLPVPVHLGLQLGATGALALAATIYQIRCPDEVKVADEVSWTRAMGQPLWEYRAAEWSRLKSRYVAAVLFAAGGLYSLLYLMRRSVDAILYLLSSW